MKHLNFSFPIEILFQIHLYSLSTQPEKLIPMCAPFIGYIECFQLKIKDDFILFGDLMHSATILRFNFDEKKFEKVINFQRSCWLDYSHL